MQCWWFYYLGKNFILYSTNYLQNVTQPWAIMAKNAIVYTDVFILISGLLNAQALFQALEKQGTMKFKDKLINRLFR